MCYNNYKLQIGGYMKSIIILTAILLLMLSASVFSANKNSLDVYDMTYINNSLPNGADNYNNAPQNSKKVWDEMHFIASLQGLVNRTGINLYVISQGEEFGDDKNGYVDKYWLKLMTGKGEWLEKYNLNYIKTLDELILKYKNAYKGLVVYDGSVYATSNAASTVAGVENLLCIRYDTDKNSLYSHLVNDLKIPIKHWLIKKDGSSLFTGKGYIPNTKIKSTGSPKCDVYIWAKTKYLDTGKCNPQMLAYYIDSYWIQNPQGRISWNTLTNHDYYIMNKGFFFDLSPWNDETPVDDINQPIGTDYNTLKEILYSAYKQNKGKVYPIVGFVPWNKKYSSYGSAGGNHAEVAGEWKYAEIISCFNGYMDADALGGMANASVFTKFPLKKKYTQKKPTIEDLKVKGYITADGKVKEATYVLLYAGDYDSGAWMYEKLSRIWIDPNRGKTPMSWAFNPNLAQRFAYGMDYLRRTATDNDYFIAGDSGAGYLNPSLLSEPRLHSNLPSGVDAWKKHNTKWLEKFDLDIIGFIIDGNAPAMNEEIYDLYAQIAPRGIVLQKSLKHDGIYKEMPYIRHEDTLIYNNEAEFINNTIKKFGKNTPDFYMFRHVLWNPSGQMSFISNMKKAYKGEIEFIDAYSFFLLLKYFYESGQETKINFKGNLFDYRNGLEIISSSPVLAKDDIRNAFSGSFNCVELNNMMFADGNPQGYTTFIEWKIQNPATIKRAVISPNGTNSLRDVSGIRLFGLDKTSNKWISLYDYKSKTHPTPMNLNFNISNPISTDTYRIEFDQYNINEETYGVRVEEIEGYTE